MREEASHPVLFAREVTRESRLVPGPAVTLDASHIQTQDDFGRCWWQQWCSQAAGTRLGVPGGRKGLR